MSNETRKLPTRAGWWWRQGTYCPYIEEVDGVAGDLYLHLTGTPVVDDGSWLAPIPGPAVCAALADCEAAELAWANGDLDDELLERAVTNAEARLYAAMRAERDGAA